MAKISLRNLISATIGNYQYKKQFENASTAQEKYDIAVAAKKAMESAGMTAGASEWNENIQMYGSVLDNDGATAARQKLEAAVSDSAGTAAANAARQVAAARLRRGFTSTLLTGGQGSFGLPALKIKTILGA